MHLQFDKLRLSLRQKSVENRDPAPNNWPRRFFWTDGLILLNWTEGLMRHIAEAAPDSAQKFLQGSLPPEIQRLHPELFARFPLTRILEYCDVWQSHKRAGTRLMLKVRGERECPKGKHSGHSIGGIALDDRQVMIHRAAAAKAVNLRGLGCVVLEAARQNDVRFFIRLGRALQSSKTVPEVDWNRVDPIPRFLVHNWCQAADYRRDLPALCFFTDQALADFCSAALEKKEGNPSSASIRQWRKRFGLKQARAPKVKETIVINDEILFVEGG
ncbi:MAG: hypothetical protein ABSF38_06680 [Verrucomicrobiota bacterium]|jgi:hypothetical protein